MRVIISSSDQQCNFDVEENFIDFKTKKTLLSENIIFLPVIAKSHSVHIDVIANIKFGSFLWLNAR